MELAWVGELRRRCLAGGSLENYPILAAVVIHAGASRLDRDVSQDLGPFSTFRFVQFGIFCYFVDGRDGYFLDLDFGRETRLLEDHVFFG